MMLTETLTENPVERDADVSRTEDPLSDLEDGSPGILDAWFERNVWLLTHPRSAVGSFALLTCVLVLCVPSAVAAFLLMPALTVLVYTLSRQAERHFRELRERELASALRNLSKGSYIGLPYDDELTRAFEQATAEAERRVRSTLGESARQLDIVQQEAEDVYVELEKEHETSSGALLALEKEKTEWLEEQSRSEEELQRLRSALEEFQARSREEEERWDSSRETLQSTRERLESELEGIQQAFEQFKTEHVEGRREADSEWERMRSELEREIEELRDRHGQSERTLESERLTGQQVREQLEKRLLGLQRRHDDERALWEHLQEKLEGTHHEVHHRTSELERELDEVGSELKKSAARESVLHEDRERLRKLTESVGGEQLRFFDSVSGQLRAPLHLARKLLDDLARHSTWEKAEETIAEIRGNLKRLRRLVEQVVDLCKLESSHWKAVYVEVNVRRLVARCVGEFHERTTKKGIEVSSDLEIDLPSLETDERLLSRAVEELLSNAVRYTPKGGKIWVVARVDGNDVEITVKDSGRGILPEDQDRIFRPFEKAGAEPRFRTSDIGAGLGLTLVRRYLELMNGSVELVSEPHAGSTFKLRVPRGVL